MKRAARHIWVAGVDGCPAGWLVALGRLAPGALRPQTLRFVLCRHFAQVLALSERPKVIAVDIPIGLLDRHAAGGRDCDSEARRLLGWPRAASVFTPPIRAALRARSYRDAIRRNRAGLADGRRLRRDFRDTGSRAARALTLTPSPGGRGRRAACALRMPRMTGRGCGLTRQAWQILPKIREVDTCLTPALQRRVIEAHPELAFMRLAGRPLRAGKKGAAGRRRRARLLQHAFGRAMPATQAVRAVLGRKAVRPDDLLDACVLVLTAQRKLRGKAQRLPPRPPRDRMGLWMEIWF